MSEGFKKEVSQTASQRENINIDDSISSDSGNEKVTFEVPPEIGEGTKKLLREIAAMTLTGGETEWPPSIVTAFEEMGFILEFDKNNPFPAKLLQLSSGGKMKEIIISGADTAQILLAHWLTEYDEPGIKASQENEVTPPKRRYIPAAELENFIQEEVLKNIPPQEQLDVTPVPEVTLAALRSVGGDFVNLRVFKDDKNIRYVEVGFVGRRRAIRHSEAIEILKKFKGTRRIEISPVPKKELVSYIEGLLGTLPSGIKLNETRVIPDTIAAVVALGSKFRSARPFKTLEGECGILVGYKKDEKFLPHTEVIRLLGEYVKNAPEMESVKQKVEKDESVTQTLSGEVESKAWSVDDAPLQIAYQPKRKRVPHPTQSDTVIELPYEGDKDSSVAVEDAGFAPMPGRNYLEKSDVSDVIPKERVEAHEIDVIPQDIPALTITPEEAMDAERERTRKELEGMRVNEASQADAFDERFLAQFGISQEDLESIDNFSSLSIGQQKLLFENFSQSVFSQMHNEAYEKTKLETEERRKEMAESEKGFVKKAWAGMREALTEDLNLLRATKESGINQKNAGFETHKEMLNFLVQSMYRSGPRVHEDPRTGELLVDLVNVREWPSGENRKQQKLASQELNKAAHAFAKIPQSWKEQTLGVDGDKKREWKITSGLKGFIFKERKQGNAYDTTEAAYMDAKANFAEALQLSGMGETEIVTKLIEIDTRTQQLQMLQTSPNAVKELSNIEDKSVWRAAARSLVSSKGVYFGLGFVSRSVAGATVGFVGAPLVASALAGVRSWNKTAAELRERDRLARMGVGDTNESSLNIVTFDGLYTKTSALLQEAYNSAGKFESDYQEALARGDGEAMDEIEKERVRILNRLQARVRYIQDKEGLQRINYGTGPQAYAKHAALIGILGEATVLLEENYAPKENKITERLNRVLNRTDAKIMEARGEYRKKDRNKQIVKALGFSLGGATLAHFGQGLFEGKQTGTRVPSSETPADAPRERGSTPAATENRAEPPAPQVVEKPTAESAVEAPAGKEIELPTDYEIQKGDSLLKIIEKNPFPNSSDGEAITQAEALRMLRSLSSDELKELGIRSGNIDKIYVGDELDLEALRVKMLEHENDMPSTQSIAAPKEDLGDFKGGEYEMDSDLLNKESQIRQSEIPNTEIIERGEKGEAVSQLVAVKAKFLETYFIRENIPPKYWEAAKKLDAEVFLKSVNASDIETPPAVSKLLEVMSKKPLLIEPQRGETLEKMMHRTFLKLTLLAEENGGGSKGVRDILRSVDRSRKYV